ncbi:S41 family peptidase [Paenibacillus rigui]|uniref:Carboxyl-terminal protease n=1 Tax=Paenibacillus rigui TaxID=554312 RepID=A0A229UWU9_9BACL|nr:S41 family peptidase [Paenibacillus rigui]OXM87932.1 carboxyl-terminal protease [Paenibacillus rigui]
MQTNGYRAIWRSTASVVLTLTLMFPSASAALAADANDATAARTKEVMELIEKNHVSAPTKQQLTGKSIEEMIETLHDPYTVYFTPEDLKRFESSLENNYVGIGVRISNEKEGLFVSEVFDNGPAQKAGMKPGDQITAVEGEPIAGLKIDEVTKKIMGPEGSKVSVTVKRLQDSLVLNMSRQTIQLPVVTHKKFDPGVGYIRVTGFSSEADEETAAQLAELKQQGINSLILDLRDNPGGLVDTAQNMAKLFVKEGILIHTKDKNNVDEPVKFSNGTTQPFPVYILVNENSASASEVLTGALQDYNAVTKVIGMNTYGKGSVQTLIPLTQGGALKVTIEEYLTPKLRKVNKVGLKPDIEVDGDVPQLVTALHETGIQKVSVALNKLGVTVNQIPVDDYFNVIKDNGQLYVPTRLVSALLGGGIAWNGETRSVEISAGGTTHTYQEGAGELLLQNGSSYINVGKFAESYPQLEWSDNGEQVVLTASKG